MAQYHIVRKSYLFAPADNTAGTITAIPVKKGTRVLFASIVPLIKGIGGDTVAVRVASAGGGNANGMYTATDTATWTVGQPVNCNGTDFDREGIMVIADSTVDIVTSGGANSTQMKFRLNVGTVREIAN